MKSSLINYRRLDKSDQVWIDKFITDHWGSNLVVVHNTSYCPSNLDGFIAYQAEEKIGLITYQVQNYECEIVTLNSVIENKGVGSRLVSLAEQEARINNCNNIWLITTNDNLRAIGFYQRIGYQLINVFPNAVEQSRKIKREIPLTAENGIPIRDELKFCKVLK